MRLGVVGAGAMGEAVIGGLIRDGHLGAESIVASTPREERRLELADRYGVRVTAGNVEAVTGADVVILAVKPQVLQRVLTELAGRLPAGALVFSIVAGASMQRIGETLGTRAVVRSMPNSPASVGHGITVWTHAPGVAPEQLEQARTVLAALGSEVFVEEESYLDMATALSGTGPSYVFLFMEALVDAGVHLGFPRHLAEQLVVQTVKGSVEFYLAQPNHLARLRNQVTSPGGTSAEALYYLERARFRSSLSRAVWAAYQRSQALGKPAEE
jgi:pyrroline-5-carboxylate reductase